MTTTIFKNENKAKVYEIRSAKDQGIYKAGELIRTVKTDNIEKLNEVLKIICCFIFNDVLK